MYGNIMHLPVTKPLCSWKACHVINWSGSGLVIQDHSYHGFMSSFDAPWSERSCITDVDLHNRKKTPSDSPRSDAFVLQSTEAYLRIHHKLFLYRKQSHNMHKNTANPNACAGLCPSKRTIIELYFDRNWDYVTHKYYKEFNSTTLQIISCR